MTHLTHAQISSLVCRFRRGVLDRLYYVAILLKGIDGLLETLGGFLFLFVSRATMNDAIIALTQHELLEDPDDWIANSLRQAFGHLSIGEKAFGGVYLLTHGLIKVFLATGLLRDKLWAFPISLAFLAVFIGYQVYRLCLHFSAALLLLSVFDLGVGLLIWREYTFAKCRT
jgi:uncharacterized membrane protein